MEDLSDREISLQTIRITADTYRVMANRADIGQVYIRNGIMVQSPGTPSVTLRRCRG